jgi:hypothetical protein
MTTLVDPQSSDAQRQEIASKFFYFLGDVMNGTDNSYRAESGYPTGTMGPYQTAGDYGVGVDGEVYMRGQASVQQQSVQGQGQIMISPTLLLLIGVGIYLATRK